MSFEIKHLHPLPKQVQDEIEKAISLMEELNIKIVKATTGLDGEDFRNGHITLMIKINIL